MPEWTGSLRKLSLSAFTRLTQRRGDAKSGLHPIHLCASESLCLSSSVSICGSFSIPSQAWPPQRGLVIAMPLQFPQVFQTHERHMAVVEGNVDAAR